MQPQLLIFHLNGTVIDVSQSIDSVVRRTIQFYLGSLLGVSAPGTLVSENDLWAFRAAGGLDDPIKLTAALLRYALSAMPSAPAQRFPPNTLSHAAGLLASRKQKLPKVTFEALESRLDFEATASALAEAGGGLSGLAALLGGWSHPLWAAVKEDELALVRRLFMELYLGRAAYSRVYREPSRFYRGVGLADNERLLVGRAALETLRHDFRGRQATFSEWPQPLVARALERFKIAGLFDAVLTAEDIIAEEARAERRGEEAQADKPHPFLVLEAAESLDPGGQKPALVIGHTLDDMRATQRASDAGERPFEGWAIVPQGGAQAERWRRLLEPAGAARVFSRTEDLLSALTTSRM